MRRLPRGRGRRLGPRPLVLLVLALGLAGRAAAQQATEVGAWLAEVGEAGSAAALASGGLRSPEQMAAQEVGDVQLAALGLRLKPRKRILKALRRDFAPSVAKVPPRSPQSRDTQPACPVPTLTGALLPAQAVLRQGAHYAEDEADRGLCAALPEPLDDFCCFKPADVHLERIGHGG